MKFEKSYSEISAQIGLFGSDILLSLNALAYIDLTLAKAKYSYQLEAAEPIIVDSTQNNNRRLDQAG